MSTYNQSLVDDMMAGTQRPLVGPQAGREDPIAMMPDERDVKMPLDMASAHLIGPNSEDLPEMDPNTPHAPGFVDANGNGIDDRLEVEHTITRDNTGLKTQKTVFRGTVPLGVSVRPVNAP